MRRAALTFALLALAGCQTCPKPPVPETVYVTVEKFVPVPEELTRDCGGYEVKAPTYGEAIRAANVRKAALEECTARMQEIRGLGQEDRAGSE